MLYRHQPFKSFALLLLLIICLPMSVQASDDYSDYNEFAYDEAMSVSYGYNIGDDTVLLPSTEAPKDAVSPPRNENQSAPEKSQETSQPRQETKEQEQVVSDQRQVLSVQGAEERSVTGPNEDLSQLASQNTNAIKMIAVIMSEVVSKLSNEGCAGGSESNSNMQLLSASIKEGFTVLVGAVQDLNATLQHYQEEITRKAFGTQLGANTFESDGPCPAPFFKAGNDCLYIETEHLRDFNTARQACIDMGAKLAEFENFQPFIDAVQEMDFNQDAAIYIGGTDEGHEGDWRWLSGGTIENLNWHVGEPNNSHDQEHCVSYSVEFGSFNDLPCTFKIEYACMKK